MAKRITTKLPPDKPFLLIEGKASDFLTVLGMGTEHLYVCPRCGIPVTHGTRVIYVAVENKVMCTRCAEHWITNARWYNEDARTEKDNFNAMVQKLKDSKLWEE